MVVLIITRAKFRPRHSCSKKKVPQNIQRAIMRPIMRPNYFFVQDCFSVGTACVFIAFIAAPYASGRRSLQTVGIFWTKYQAIRCLQYGAYKKVFAIRFLQKVVCVARQTTIARRAARKNHSILSMMSRSSLIRSRSSRV